LPAKEVLVVSGRPRPGAGQAHHPARRQQRLPDAVT
jgi:hypothetical protein